MTTPTPGPAIAAELLRSARLKAEYPESAELYQLFRDNPWAIADILKAAKAIVSQKQAS